MVSRQPVPGPCPTGEGSQEKAMTVRSVLLNRDSPDAQSRLKRRRNRTQQVRFKDLVEGGTGRAPSPPPAPAAAPSPNTPRASPPPRVAPELAASRASRRSWPQAQTGPAALPVPSRACASTASQTSPSIRRPSSAPQTRSRSSCDTATDVLLPAGTKGSARCVAPSQAVPTSQAVPPSQTVPTGQAVCSIQAVPTSQAVPPSQTVATIQAAPPVQAVPPSQAVHSSQAVPSSLPMCDGTAALAQRATACRVPPPPPPRDPCPPYPGTAGCPAARCPSSAQSSTPEPCPLRPACAQLRGSREGGRTGPPRPASVPCGQPWPPVEPRGLGRSDSERTLPRGHPTTHPSPHRQRTVPAMNPLGLHQPPQGNPLQDPPPPQHQLWGGPCCTPPAPTSPVPGWYSSATAAPEKTPAAPGRPDTCGTCGRPCATAPGHSRAGLGGPGEPPPPNPGCPGVGVQPSGWAPEVPWHRQPCLAAEQPDALSHVQDLLQLVVVTKGPVAPPAGSGEPRTSQGEGPGAQGDLQSQLQSLEGVLETSQQTIRVLLGVIQDLEKKEAQRDGRHSYRTGQDITNCGTCRDCACIIYSVEHDFRQQEGRFQRVLSHIEGDGTPSSPATAAGPVLLPRQEPPLPVPKLPAKLDMKKSRRKCFWFL